MGYYFQDLLESLEMPTIVDYYFQKKEAILNYLTP